MTMITSLPGDGGENEVIRPEHEKDVIFIAADPGGGPEETVIRVIQILICIVCDKCGSTMNGFNMVGQEHEGQKDKYTGGQDKRFEF